jgi:hypothetical protein
MGRVSLWSSKARPLMCLTYNCFIAAWTTRSTVSTWQALQHCPYC